jgi:hypothetical protein
MSTGASLGRVPLRMTGLSCTEPKSVSACTLLPGGPRVAAWRLRSSSHSLLPATGNGSAQSVASDETCRCAQPKMSFWDR